mgnify:CR=1 FL=1
MSRKVKVEVKTLPQILEDYLAELKKLNENLTELKKLNEELRKIHEDFAKAYKEIKEKGLKWTSK